jgi:hypothetical protein
MTDNLHQTLLNKLHTPLSQHTTVLDVTTKLMVCSWLAPQVHQGRPRGRWYLPTCCFLACLLLLRSARLASLASCSTCGQSQGNQSFSNQHGICRWYPLHPYSIVFKH